MFCRENHNTHFVLSNISPTPTSAVNPTPPHPTPTAPPENRAIFCDNVEKYSRTGQATDDNTAHALLYIV